MLFDVHHVRGSVRFGRLSAPGNAGQGFKQFSPSSSCSFIAVLSGLVYPTYEFVYLGKSRIADLFSFAKSGRSQSFRQFESLRPWRDNVFCLAATMRCQNWLGRSLEVLRLMFRSGSQSGRQERTKSWRFGFAQPAPVPCSGHRRYNRTTGGEQQLGIGRVLYILYHSGRCLDRGKAR